MSVPCTPEAEKPPDSETPRSGHTPDRGELWTTSHRLEDNEFVIRP